jgi:pimeloyl-ACP methyl ester carboxylesterase
LSHLSKYFLTATLFASAAQAAPLPSTNATTTYHRVQVDGVGIFYREAGPENAPTIVLLHGFPSSSREFDTLIPLLATKYHLIAPDYPGFGLSDAPSPTAYTYTFDHLAQTLSDFLEKLKVTHYTMYLHDYGAPIGFRIILAHPDQLHALIIQNGNIYKAGLGAKWTKIAEYWADPKAHPEVINAFLSFEGTKERHLAGTSHPDRYDPDTWISEYTDLSRPGQREIQGDLLYDYRTNVALYPKWQAWLRDPQPPTLVVWGENDPSFIAPGAEAFRQDLPNADIHLLDAGHFALDEKTDEIADLILQFMAKHPG